MPGYRWTVHKSSNPERLAATGIQSSGFNRLSTLQVNRTEKGGAPWYSVRSAPHGAKSLFAAEIGGLTLARALRDLQTHYQRKAANYRALASRLEEGRATDHPTQPPESPNG
ncbi:hypothetical protein WAF00_02790 [Mameliella alba]|uniref:hypothetical protein n=1 Tax=Mameliella alba TaxID=561184 RepID=UPI001553DA6E|nr:hypothetical protein [Mameliella alba]